MGSLICLEGVGGESHQHMGERSCRVLCVAAARERERKGRAIFLFLARKEKGYLDWS